VGRHANYPARVLPGSSRNRLSVAARGCAFVDAVVAQDAADSRPVTAAVPVRNADRKLHPLLIAQGSRAL